MRAKLETHAEELTGSFVHDNVAQNEADKELERDGEEHHQKLVASTTLQGHNV